MPNGFKRGSVTAGGVIRGPGSGISDSIARDMFAGSFILPADSTRFFGVGELQRLASLSLGRLSHRDYGVSALTVYQLGWNILQTMRIQTHTPVPIQVALGEQ